MAQKNAAILPTVKRPVLSETVRYIDGDFWSLGEMEHCSNEQP
jgi:hypothetical protein